MGYSSIVYSSYTEFITEVRLVEQKLPTLSDIAYPFRNCLPFQKLPTLSDIAYPFRNCLPFQILPTLSETAYPFRY
jgi:hypothetical protein